MYVLHPGDFLLDFSFSRLTDPQIALALRTGAKGFFRYSAGAASNPAHPRHADVKGKLITPDEYTSLISRGADIVANDEWYTSRVTEGYKAGKADGQAAGALWHSCGHPKGATVYCSWDEAPKLLKYWSVRQYLKGWGDGANHWYIPGLYAGTGVLKSKTVGVKFGWRPNAGSWSNDGLPYQPRTGTSTARTLLVAQALKATPAKVWQTGNYWFGTNDDENIVLRVPLGSRNDILSQTQPAPLPRQHANSPREIASQDGHFTEWIRNDGVVIVSKDNVKVREL